MPDTYGFTVIETVAELESEPSETVSRKTSVPEPVKETDGETVLALAMEYVAEPDT